MPFGLLKYGFSKKHPAPCHCTAPDALKPPYDVVIIGGGHGLATAYSLARDYGITNAAAFERGRMIAAEVNAMAEWGGAAAGLAAPRELGS